MCINGDYIHATHPRHVESIALLQRMSNTRSKEITLDVDMENYHRIKSALIDQPKVPNRQIGGLSGGIDGGLAEKIIEYIRAYDTVTVSEMAESLGIPKRTIEREMKRLRDSERISREGGNRYGHWKINQKD